MARPVEVGVSEPPGGRVDPQSDDASALRRAAAGDWAAFDELVDRYKGRLFRHIRRRVVDPHRAEDLTQEVFLRLFRAARAGGYTGEARVVTWLFTIAQNVTTDHLRAAGRQGGRPAAASSPVNREADPLDAAQHRESTERVMTMLADLPEAQRAVVELHVLDGLSFGEVAELLGCPVPTAKSRLVYALRKLKSAMDHAAAQGRTTP